MKTKIFIVLSAIFLIFTKSVFAEQPAAEEYRKIFQSGTFYVEYSDSNETKILAAFDNKRMERIQYLKMNWVTYFNPLGALFGGSGSKCPEVLYQNGKYYQFVDEDVAIVLSENKLSDPNLDPRQGWNCVAQKLAVPYELSVFYWNDSYRKKSNAISVPRFVNSSKKKIDNTEYDCDEYISDVKAQVGGQNTQIIYEMYYKDGKLVEAHYSILRNGTKYPVNNIKIKNLQGEIPKGAFKIHKKTKVYAAGIGDIDDLTQKLVQVETLEALKQ